jgi:hypothetical protein
MSQDCTGPLAIVNRKNVLTASKTPLPASKPAMEVTLCMSYWEQAATLDV